MRKPKIATAVATAALVGGMGIGSFIAPPLSAFAADDSTAATAAATARTPGQWITDSLKGLVDKGTITQDQSNAVASALEANKPAGGPGGHGGFGGVRVDSTKVAELLGLSAADLRTELQTKSVATIASEKNVDLQSIIDALVSAANTRIDQQVTDGDITQAQGDERKADTTARVTEEVNEVHVGRGPGGGRGDYGTAPAPSTDAPAGATTTTAPAA